MSWAKLSDDYGDDCWTLSDEAFRLHTEALVWNGRKLLDCRISKADVRRFAKRPDAAQELLDVGWWTEDGDYYLIRHHARYQRTREAVVNQQEANKLNRSKGVARPVRESASELKPKSPTTSVSGSSDESSDGSSDERDRTGQAAVTGTPDKLSSAKSDPRFWKTDQEMEAEQLPPDCPDCGRPCQTEPASGCGCPYLHQVA